jgi:hypothetical protein
MPSQQSAMLQIQMKKLFDIGGVYESATTAGQAGPAHLAIA